MSARRLPARRTASLGFGLGSSDTVMAMVVDLRGWVFHKRLMIMTTTFSAAPRSFGLRLPVKEFVYPWTLWQARAPLGEATPMRYSATVTGR